MLSPMLLEVLLWHYTRTAQYEGWIKHEATNDPAGREKRLADAWNQLKAAGLLEFNDELGTYQLGARGLAYVEALLGLQLPVQKWVIP